MRLEMMESGEVTWLSLGFMGPNPGEASPEFMTPLMVPMQSRISSPVPVLGAGI